LLQIFASVCAMFWAPQLMQESWSWSTWAFAAPRLVVLAGAAVWHGVLRQAVLSPLPYAVLALQLSLGQPLWGLAVLAMAVNQRALENLIHEMSHFCLFRSRYLQTPSHSPVKFYFATLFARLIFRDIGQYRASHKKHHGSFGDREIDPDTIIYDRAQVTSWSDVLKVTAVWYWENVECAVQTRPVTLACLASAALFARVAALTWWPAAFLGELCAWWLAAYFVVLPFLRMIAEHEEHNGLIPEGDQPLDSLFMRQWALTWTNDGFLHRWIFHPCGDGYHSLHHLTSRVPFFRLQEVHYELLRTQPIYASHCQINRMPFVRAFAWQSTAKSQ